MLNRRSFLRAALSSPLMVQFVGSESLLHAADEQQDQRDETLTKGRPTNVESLADAIVIKKDTLFFVAQPDGDVPLRSGHGMGLYYHDCRYLNGYELRLAGQPPAPLSASSVQGSAGVFTLTNRQIEFPDGGTLDKEEIGVTWRRLIDSDQPALLDRLTFRNFTLRTVRFDVTLTFRSAFEDLFNVRGLLSKQYGRLRDPAWLDGVLQFVYDGQDGVRRALSVHADPLPDEHRSTTATFHVRIGPQEQHDIRLSLVIGESKEPNAVSKPPLPKFSKLESELEEEMQEWIARVTTISGNGSALDQLMERSFRGLRVLRTRLGRESYFAAGVPWFVTLFGRDSLITAWQMLAYHHGIAEQTLRLLARYQGTREDDWRDEQPGKILHELRVGEMANLNKIPHTPFYGTVDATPLFLMLVAEHAAWTGSLRLFDDLRPHIERALSWMDTYGDHRGDGYLSYLSRAKDKNLINKGWKDSGDAIVTASGSLAEPPIALVEVQGYGYAAKRGMARLFARAGERERADRLNGEAQRLRERFNRDFWMEDKNCYALALHGQGRVASVISSNPGHALWTGIADNDKAGQTIQRLMEDDMFTGWGVRTLSSLERAYNPIGYHLGTVWPHDNAILAAGFRRYGRDQEALRIFHGLFDTAFHFRSHQLPELFCGFSRQEYEIPISYPVACHPQAWASGALPFILANLLGLEPDGFDKRLHIVRPLLPNGLDHLTVRRLRVGKATVDLNFQRDVHGARVEVLKVEGELEVQVDKGA